jgi:hypothetical protein
VLIYWSRRQALTRRNISRHHPAEEAAVGVEVVGVVVQLGEGGEKAGMGKWMWTRVRKSSMRPFLFGSRLFIGAKLTNDTTDQCTSFASFFRPYTRFTFPVLVLLCITITDPNSRQKV